MSPSGVRHGSRGTKSGKTDPVAFNGQDERYELDNENPELPSNVHHALWQSVEGDWPNVIFANFEVCPLNNERPEVMQAACIESAKNIVINKDD